MEAPTGKRFDRLMKISRKKTLKAFRHELEKQLAYCHYCGKYVEKKDRTVDHKVPVSKGGGDGIENLVLACKDCNGLKGSMSYRQFKKYLNKIQPTYHEPRYHRKIVICPYVYPNSDSWKAYFVYNNQTYYVEVEGSCSKKQIIRMARRKIDDLYF